MSLTTNATVGNYTRRASVESSNLSEVLYDDDTHTLFVRFRNGNVAGYKNVPLTNYDRLVAANSAGRYYNSNIKPVFAGVRAPDEFVLRTSVVDNVVNEAPVNLSDRARLVKDTSSPETLRYNVTLRFESADMSNLIDTLNSLGFLDAVVGINEV